MADTPYPNLNLSGPEVNSSDGTWGGKLNTNFSIIDSQFAPSGTGTVVRKDSLGQAVAAGVFVNTPVAAQRTMGFYTNGQARWQLICNGSAETGSGNAGSDFGLLGFDDTGAVVTAEMFVTRSTGAVSFNGSVNVAGSPVVTQATAGAFAPVIGAIQMFAGATAPANWMICDGSSLSTTTFATLFGVINYAFGGSGGSFNIPNLKGRVVVGVDGSASFPSLGSTFGTLTHQLSAAEMPSHVHTLHEAPHSHGITPSRAVGVANTPVAVSVLSLTTPSTPITTDPASPVPTMDSAGGDGPHNNVQPSIALNFIIRVQ